VTRPFRAGTPALICLVTDGRRLARQRPGEDVDDAIVAQVRAAAGAGVDLVQVREPAREGASLLRLVERCVAEAHGSSTRIVVNDRLDVALVAGAAGVHLKGESFPGGRVRAVAPRPFLVGRSVHQAAGMAALVRGGVLDYVVAGTVFDSPSKPGQAPSGLAALREMVAAAGSTPVLAVGGVSLETAGDVAAAGAAGLAAIGLFMPGDGWPPLADTVQRLRRAFDSGRGAR
jgi:thiamine-phosphate pyrophosphorylase